MGGLGPHGLLVQTPGGRCLTHKLTDVLNSEVQFPAFVKTYLKRVSDSFFFFFVL